MCVLVCLGMGGGGGEKRGEERGKSLQSCVCTRARLGYAAFDA